MDATYTFDPDTEGRDAVIVTAHVVCGRDGKSRKIVVAELHDPASSMPGLLIKSPLGVNAVEEICAIVRAAFIGPRTGPGVEAAVRAHAALITDVRNQLGNGQERRP